MINNEFCCDWSIPTMRAKTFEPWLKLHLSPFCQYFFAILYLFLFWKKYSDDFRPILFRYKEYLSCWINMNANKFLLLCTFIIFLSSNADFTFVRSASKPKKIKIGFDQFDFRWLKVQNFVSIVWIGKSNSTMCNVLLKSLYWHVFFKSITWELWQSVLPHYVTLYCLIPFETFKFWKTRVQKVL